jgi:hypothetical protein
VLSAHLSGPAPSSRRRHRRRRPSLLIAASLLQEVRNGRHQGLEQRNHRRATTYRKEPPSADLPLSVGRLMGVSSASSSWVWVGLASVGGQQDVIEVAAGRGQQVRRAGLSPPTRSTSCGNSCRPTMCSLIDARSGPLPAAGLDRMRASGVVASPRLVAAGSTALHASPARSAARRSSRPVASTIRVEASSWSKLCGDWEARRAETSASGPRRGGRSR